MDGRMDESTPVLINNKEQGQVLANFLMTLRVGRGGHIVGQCPLGVGAWGPGAALQTGYCPCPSLMLSQPPSASLFYYHWPRML